jgi:N-acetylmuramoyl-L-alanine amidase
VPSRSQALALLLAALAGLALVVGVAAAGAGSAPVAVGAAASGVTAGAADAARPPIVKWLIPFGAKRKHQMAAYSERHYGERTWRLVHPKVIVEHMSEASSVSSVRNTFALDVPDVELHELPQVCSHFVIGSSGKIFELVNLRTRCRHTVGLNWTAIGIEHVGYADSDAYDNPAEMRASLRLTQWLRCRFGIGVKNVIGHNESLSSPFHREDVPSLRTQTHGDWRHSSMQIYRHRLRALGPC